MPIERARVGWGSESIEGSVGGGKGGRVEVDRTVPDEAAGFACDGRFGEHAEPCVEQRDKSSRPALDEDAERLAVGRDEGIDDELATDDRWLRGCGVGRCVLRCCWELLKGIAVFGSGFAWMRRAGRGAGIVGDSDDEIAGQE
jgi:hypothetical protein